MTSMLEAAAARAKARADRLVRLPNPEDLGQVFTCRVPSDGVRLDALRKGAEKLDHGRGADVLWLRAIVAECVVSIEDLGEVLVGADGEPLRFTDGEFRQAMHAATAGDCVKAFMGNDGPITTLGNKLLELAGYADEDAFLDPIPA